MDRSQALSGGTAGGLSGWVGGGVVRKKKTTKVCTKFLHCRIGFELSPWLCNVLRCCQAYHTKIGLHYIIVFESISRLCNLVLHHSRSFKLHYFQWQWCWLKKQRISFSQNLEFNLWLLQEVLLKNFSEDWEGANFGKSSEKQIHIFCASVTVIAKRPASYRDPKPRNPKFLEKTQK